jgi:dihydrofolate reductase
VWVIGGASVYAAALPLADRLVVTELAEPFEGDVRAPEIPPGWAVDGGPAPAWTASSTALRYRVLRYFRV